MRFQELLRPDTALVLGPAFGPAAGKDVVRMSAPLIRVLVVDDSAFMRGVLPTKIEADPRFKVIGIACNGREAIDIGVIPLDAGDWMTHCHILEHAEAGMMTMLAVRDGRR